MSDKNNVNPDDNQPIDRSRVKATIKERYGEYIKIVLNVGASIKGDKLYATGKIIDDAMKTAMGADKYFLMSSKYMVYSTGFVIKNGITIHALYVAYKQITLLHRRYKCHNHQRKNNTGTGMKVIIAWIVITLLIYNLLYIFADLLNHHQIRMDKEA